MNRNTKTVVWAISQVLVAVMLTSALFLSSGCDDNGSRNLHVLVTGDVHGSWFNTSYIDGSPRSSLMAVKSYVDSVRNAVGGENVLLIDAGDCLQGDIAPYYFNTVASDEPHLYPRLASYMGYDAVVVGNHDVEAGHNIYDRVNVQMRKAGIPWLAGNAMRTDDGKPYFQEYAVFKRAGIRILVLGFTNPNIPAWVNANQWTGIEFRSLVPFVQERVDAIKSKVKPDVTIVAVHSGTGDGSGKQLENQGMDLFQSLKGVDLVICAHDHNPVTRNGENIILVNSGSHAKTLGHAMIDVDMGHGKVLSKKISSEIINVDMSIIDGEMRDAFTPEFERVRAFTTSAVGSIGFDIRTRDSYAGQSAYVSLIHTVQFNCAKSQLSFAAPLTFNKEIKSGVLVYNDIQTIYPYENQLFKISLSGNEILAYMEDIYDKWIQTYDGKHVLRIVNKDDARTGNAGWSFVNRSYNFDSVAGLNYTVDVTRPAGERITITALSDGSSFDPESTYTVAVSSYRCNAYGWSDRIIETYPEIRELVYNFIKTQGMVSEPGDVNVLGQWSFVPDGLAGKAVSDDMALLFGK